MKKLSSALLLLSLSLLLCAASVDALGEQARQPLAAVWSYQTEAGVVCVRSDSLDGEAWLFLPACADLSALSPTAAPSAPPSLAPAPSGLPEA